MLIGSAFVFGLVIGSFLNVVIYRLPRGESIVRPRSACPHCGHLLGFFDLVPVFSFLFLRGRCRYCHGRISWQYPLVEGITGAAFALLAWRYGLSSQAAGYAVYAALLIAIAGIDLGHQIVPDVLSLPGIGIGLLFGLAQGSLVNSLLGALIGGGALLAVYLAALFLLKKEGLGLGDAKLMAMIGAFLGWQGALFTILAGSLLGSVAGLVLLAKGRLRMGEPMPFGPYLAAGGLILAIWPWELWLGPLFGF